MGIVGATYSCYWDSSVIYFIADDFLWLERVIFQINKEPFTIFKSEGLYFDPLVYLVFWLNYILAGLDPAWYHSLDIFIHTLNALLVAYLALLLTKNKTAAFLSGLIFAISPTNADSVLWPSSRVDTLACLFYLGSIVSYLRYQKDGKFIYYLLSIASFIISLSAKITPIILPAVILVLEITSDKGKDYKNSLLRALPFFLISVFFIALLSYASPMISQSTGVANGLNIREFLKSITVLFFPESLISVREGFYINLAIILLLFLSAFGMTFISFRNSLLALIMIMAITAPLLFLQLSFVYATPANPPFYVLGSVSHRLYLAVAGLSILNGITVSFFLKKLEKYSLLQAVVLILLTAGIIIYGNSYIMEKKRLWWLNGEEYRGLVEKIRELEVEKGEIQKASKLYLMGIRMQRKGIIQSVLRIYFDNANLVTEPIKDYTQIPDINTTKERVIVLVLNESGDFINITPKIIEYQEKEKSAENRDSDHLYRAILLTPPNLIGREK